MKLEKLVIRRMPGIDDSFALTDLGPGLNLIVGANGSGKTTLCRAVRATLWPGAERVQRAWVEAEWRAGDARLRSVRDGSEVEWQRDGLDAEPPDLPDGRLARCFTLGMLDLLIGTETDEGIAREVRRQMAGGYDLEAVLEESFLLRPRHGFTEKKVLASRQRGLVSLQQSQRQLADRERELEGLERDLDDARVARRTVERLGIAAELLQARERATALRAERATEALGCDPQVLALIRGDERERLTDLDRERHELGEQVAEVERALAEAEAVIAGCRLVAPLADGQLAVELGRARQLQELDGRIRVAGNDEARASGRLEAAASELDPAGSGRAPKLEGAALEPASRLLHAMTELRHRRAGLETRRSLVTEAPPDGREELLRLGAHILRDQLASAGRVRKSWQTAAVLGVAVVTLVLGAVLTRTVDRLWVGLAGLGAGALLAAALIGRSSAVERRSRQRRFRELGLEPPTGGRSGSAAGPAIWSRSAVRERLRELERELARVLQDREGAAEARRIDADLAELELRERELAPQRQRLRTALGVDPGLSDLSALVLAERVRAYDEAERELAAANDLSERLQAERARRADLLNGFLTMNGEAPLGDDEPGDSYQERLIDLKDRSLRLERTLGERERFIRDRDGLRLRGDRLDERRAVVYRDLGVNLDDDDGLDRLLALRPAYVDSLEEAKLVAREIRERERELAADPELAELGRDEIADRLAAARARVARLEELAGQVGAIREQIEGARAGDAIERALAARSAALDELKARREEALHRTAGRFLVERVIDLYADQMRPQLLQRAMQWFSAFTHRSYELRVAPGPDGTAVFRAFETSTGRGLSLSQLSDGTRMQLLLAVRLAFATRTERSERLPIFLDEVLTTSDPVRFRAVAESIALLVQEHGRQVFYLTSNPTDMAHWREILAARGMEKVTPIDIGVVRGRAAAVVDAVELIQPVAPKVPAPSWQRSPEEYAVELGVPRFDPRRPARATHLFYLLRDDLQLLYVLLTAYIDTVGKWSAWRREGSASALVNPAEARRIDAEARLLDAFVAAWRIGRGRPIDRAVLEESGAVSDRFLRGLASLTEELGGSPRELLRIIELKNDVRVKGFRIDKIIALREFLLERGYLDERPTLSSSEVEARVVAAVSAGGLDDPQAATLDAAHVARRVRAWWALSPGQSE